MSLVARYLENSGIPTVVVGSALDIIEHVGVHAICIQISLGNPLGTPYDREMQRQHVDMALDLLDKASRANTVSRSPFSWQGDAGWRDDYSRVTDANRATLAAAGEARRAKQIVMKKTNPKQQIPMP